MKSMLRSLAIAVALFATGCTNFGPTHNTQEFFDVVRDSGIDDDIQFARRGTWLHNPDPWADNFKEGVLALSETSVVFLQWNGGLERFQVSFRRDLLEIDGITLSGWGVGRKLQTYGDGFYDVFLVSHINEEEGGEEELLAFFERNGIERTEAKEG